MEKGQYQQFGNRLKSSRKRAKLTQEQVRARTGIGQGSLSELENGHHKSSTFTPLLAKEYGVNAFWLATGEGSETGISDPFLGANLTNVELDFGDKSNNNLNPPVMDWLAITKNNVGLGQMFEGTFRYKYEGDLMSGPGEHYIPTGAVVRVDATKQAAAGRVALGNIAGRPMIGVFQEIGESAYLCPSNRQYNAIEVRPDQIIGCVTGFEKDYQ